MGPNKNRPCDADRARQMVESTELIISFSITRTFENLLTDIMLKSSVERQFGILREASSHISLAIQALYLLID